DRSMGWAVIVRMFNGCSDKHMPGPGYEAVKRGADFETGPIYFFYPRGMRTDKKYQITFDSRDETIERSGYETMQQGIRLRLENAGMSELIIYKLP
ncbi:MAG: hypothetical protein FWE82_09160, partial [Defluviitaleaceae bacterium]|nr:hypothetical protein [Defluviitaleaceae bacterium]